MSYFMAEILLVLLLISFLTSSSVFLTLVFLSYHLQDRLQDWLRKSKRLIVEEATKNKSFDLNDCMFTLSMFLYRNPF